METYPENPPEGGQTIFPARIERLRELARNLWWIWNPAARRLFADLDRDLWAMVNHNPVRLLNAIPRARLQQAADDRYYQQDYDRALADFDAYLAARKTWFGRTFPNWDDAVIAYFSPEFGLHESLPIYAGGLGVLSGDHSKAASDLGLPLVGVGFVYQQGYFRQRIAADGWQEEYWQNLDYADQAMQAVRESDGRLLRIAVELPGRALQLGIWRLQVGRTPLFLMDSDLPENSAADRELTARLYAADRETRISQELVLGVGGVRALRALGIHPAVWHMNEGHSAFMIVERVAERVATGSDFESAVAAVRASTIFTTHTPVSAGNEVFTEALIDKYLCGYRERMGLKREAFMELAAVSGWRGRMFSLPTLALRCSARRNGVSALHGKVSRRMWRHLWPQRQRGGIPIEHITNGVHTESWLARRIVLLFDRYLGENWRERLDERETWQRVEAIPDEELWETHCHLKRKLHAFVRARVAQRGGALPDADALTIGFARRFAVYKRAGLLLHDMERLLALLYDSKRPLQIIFAGKAHPADEPGKHIIQALFRAAASAECGGRLAFIQDYDQNVARQLLQGVDIWLNTPRRPQEACGTSGQKAALNGVLNVSILDGWWPEGFNGRNGWAIGDETTPAEAEEHDARDAGLLYELLEDEVVPLYYRRDGDGLPREWIGMMKASIASVTPVFSARRMVKEYCTRMYAPVRERARPPRGG
ncbi:MAG: alpha-glucan family phosphorylase [Anaerolineales bacterium]|jgi:starch phosphorylase|nr:alpha-glucan family phosphorylase [Anaerolineales bacterium]